MGSVTSHCFAVRTFRTHMLTYTDEITLVRNLTAATGLAKFALERKLAVAANVISRLITLRTFSWTNELTPVRNLTSVMFLLRLSGSL